MPLLSMSISSSPASDVVQLVLTPAARLLGQLLGPVRLKLQLANQVGRLRAGGQVVEHDDQLAQAAMKLADDDLDRCLGVQQPRREACRLRRPAAADRVEERPRRTRHGLRYELVDVLAGDRAAGSVEGQLLELGVGQLAHATPIDVAFAHVRADTLGQQARGAGREVDLELLGAAADPALHPFAGQGRKLAHGAACRGDRVAQHALLGRAAAARGEQVEEAQRIARRDLVDQPQHSFAGGRLAQQRGRLTDDDQRAGREHRRHRQPLDDLLDDLLAPPPGRGLAALFLVAARAQHVERLAGSRLELGAEIASGALDRPCVGTKEVGQVRPGHRAPPRPTPSRRTSDGRTPASAQTTSSSRSARRWASSSSGLSG